MSSFSFADRLRIELDYDFSSWCALLETLPRHYEQSLHSGGNLSARQIESLAQTLDLDPERLRTGQVDIRALVRRRSGDVCALPERYSTAPMSKRRTSAYIFDYLERTVGWRTRHELMRSVQINESIIAQLDSSVNVLLVSDVAKAVTKLLGPRAMSRVGAASASIYRLGPLGQAYRHFVEAREVYEATIVEMVPKYWDQNFKYRLIRLDATSCVIESRNNPDVAEALRLRNVGCEEACDQRAGIIASLPEYIGLPHGRVTETHCVHRGDEACRFEVDFSASASSGLGHA